MTEVGAARAHQGTVRVPEIEGLRALAAGLVFVFHLSGTLNLLHPGLISAGPYYWIARFGPLGVAVFFVLSGFLLYQPFVRAALDERPSPRVGSYYLRRCARILPAYWVALAVYLFVVGPDQVKNLGEALEFFGLLQNYHAGNMLRGLGVAWTLVIEFSFYLVLPLVAWLMRELGPRRTRRGRLTGQIVGIGIVYALGIASRFWAQSHRSPYAFAQHLWRPLRYIDMWLPGYLDWFALGLLLALGAAAVRDGGSLPRWVSALVRRPGWSVAIAVVLYVLIQQANYPTVRGQAYTFQQLMIRNTAMPWIAFFLVMPIVLGSASDGGSMRSVLRSRPMVAIGTVSYGVYLWHLIVMYQVVQWIVLGDLPRNAVVQTAVVVVLTAVAATLSYVVIERPFIRWATRNRRALGRQERVPAPTPVSASTGPGRSQTPSNHG